MTFELPLLPYPKTALAPYIGAETVERHYEKHHRGYLDKLNQLVRGMPEADRSLEELIRTTSGEVFNNAAQVWNHNFYWRSLRPDGGGEPPKELADPIDASFGSYRGFRTLFTAAAVEHFGSGWVWVVRGVSGRLRVWSSSDAETPLQRGLLPLLTLDLWEHAYYLDYHHERARYVECFLDHLLDWDFLAANAMASPASAERRDLHGEGNPEAEEHYRDRATAFAKSDRLKPAANRAARSPRS